jgi:hypothetical protein
MEMKGVYSNWVAEIGYDEETRELVYVTKKGDRIVHSDVDPETARKVGALGSETPPSIGEALHQWLRPWSRGVKA